MYDYITKELPKFVESMFPVDASRKSITGHSMGGHGALICHLKNPGAYKSVSAFAPSEFMILPSQFFKSNLLLFFKFAIQRSSHGEKRLLQVILGPWKLERLMMLLN